MNKIKFIVDECAGTALTTWLRKNGFDAFCITELIPATADSDIQRIAFTQERIIVTVDKDFGELVFKAQLPHHGVVLMRPNSTHPEAKIKIMSMVLTKYSEQLFDNFVTASEHLVRIVQIKKHHH